MYAGTAIRDLLLLIALAPLAYYIVAVFAAHKFFQPRRNDAADFTPAISILKPIRGLDRETYENYASFCRQNYPEFEILFCVSDECDPAVPVIRRIIAEFPGRSIRMLVGYESVGVNDKVNKLCRMAREAGHEVILVSDSDVRVAANFLRSVVQPLRNSDVGGVSCLYRGLTDGSFAADFEAIGNSTDFAPSVIVAQALGPVDFMLGAVMVTTQKSLAEIGGFEAIANYFCDDFELGNRIAKRGLRVEISRTPVEIVYPYQTFGEAIRHQLRWLLSIRYSRPAGHFGLIFSQGLPWVLLAAAIAPTWARVAGYLVAYLALRFLMAIQIGAKDIGDRAVLRNFWMIPIRDTVFFVVWIASFFPQRIHWRGQEFYVRERKLVAVDRG